MRGLKEVYDSLMSDFNTQKKESAKLKLTTGEIKPVEVKRDFETQSGSYLSCTPKGIKFICPSINIENYFISNYILFMSSISNIDDLFKNLSSVKRICTYDNLIDSIGDLSIYLVDVIHNYFVGIVNGEIVFIIKAGFYTDTHLITVTLDSCNTYLVFNFKYSLLGHYTYDKTGSFRLRIEDYCIFF